MWRASKNGHQILRRRVGDDWQVARSARRHSALGAVLTRVLGCGRDILSGVACRNVFPSFLCARVSVLYLELSVLYMCHAHCAVSGDR